MPGPELKRLPLNRRLPLGIAFSDGDWRTIRWPAEPHPYTANLGDQYWLYVWGTGDEQRVPPAENHSGKCDVRGVLNVHVVAVSDDGIEEETRTRNRPSLKRAHVTNYTPPRGRGWVLVDHSADEFCVWRRIRSWEVVQ